ncbi:leucine-rich repeat-containing protein 15-like [Leguminivora glycinivorella]|uniref:leucine-rich repeat-containing protein 15-like n=1 Tax=Leguminivora glycinivorella TaxID=1035111 RepID=UPI00200F8071|nr:leucine-rich repeat-containing protein 15-like [Leguminivora glycinivorella]
MSAFMIMVLLLQLAAFAFSDSVTWRACQVREPYRERFPSSGLDINATFLDLNNCNIKTLNPGAFHDFPNLDTILLSGNKFEDIDLTIFTSVTKLNSLMLSSNKFKEIPNFSEHSLPNLEKLSFANNQITTLNNSKTFSRTTQLQKLSLGFNLIEYIHPDIFKPLINLRELYLNNNKIKVISGISFPISLKIFGLWTII